MSKSLFDIGADMAALDQLFTEYDQSFQQECQIDADNALSRWLTELDTEQSTKIDNYRAYIRKLESEIAVAKSLEDQYRQERKTREKRVEWLKGRMKAYMETRRLKKIVTDTLGQVSIVQNGGQCALELDAVDWQVIQTIRHDIVWVKYEPDKEAIRKALEAGESFTFARLLPRGTQVRIK